MYVTVDGLGNPLRLCLTAGQRHDIIQAQHRLKGFDFEHLIADRGINAVIPPHQHAKILREYDEWLCREWHLVECFIRKIKLFRRIFSRFDKLDSSYSGFLHLVSTLISMR